MHLDQTLSETQHRLEHRYAADIRDYDEIHRHILVMADALSEGIMSQFPSRFRDDVMSARNRPAVAFVLSGGASLGAVQVGMLRALYEHAIAPDVIVGTSAGAINGAFIVSRPQTVATADALAAIWSGVRRARTFPLNPVTGMFGLLGMREHLIGDGGARAFLERRDVRARSARPRKTPRRSAANSA